MPESTRRGPPSTSSRKRWSAMPSASSARRSSPTRCSASASGSSARWARSAPMTSPRSPRVLVTSVTGQCAASSASSAPAVSVSSSGCATTTRTRLIAGASARASEPVGSAVSGPWSTLMWLLGAARPGGRLRPLVGVQDHLADADRLGGDLDALVLAGELQRLLERQRPRRGEVLERLRRRGADVVELLLLGDVDVHVVTTGVLPHDLTLVHLRRGLHEEAAALLQREHRERRGHTGAVGDQRTGGAELDRTRPGLVALGDRRRD